MTIYLFYIRVKSATSDILEERNYASSEEDVEKCSKHCVEHTVVKVSTVSNIVHKEDNILLYKCYLISKVITV